MTSTYAWVATSSYRSANSRRDTLTRRVWRTEIPTPNRQATASTMAAATSAGSGKGVGGAAGIGRRATTVQTGKREGRPTVWVAVATIEVPVGASFEPLAMAWPGPAATCAPACAIAALIRASIESVTTTTPLLPEPCDGTTAANEIRWTPWSSVVTGVTNRPSGALAMSVDAGTPAGEAEGTVAAPPTSA